MLCNIVPYQGCPVLCCWATTTSAGLDTAPGIVQAIQSWLEGDPEGRAAEIPGLVDTVPLAPEQLLSFVCLIYHRLQERKFGDGP